MPHASRPRKRRVCAQAGPLDPGISSDAVRAGRGRRRRGHADGPRVVERVNLFVSAIFKPRPACPLEQAWTADVFRCRSDRPGGITTSGCSMRRGTLAADRDHSRVRWGRHIRRARGMRQSVGARWSEAKLRAAHSTLCLMPWLREPLNVRESGSTPLGVAVAASSVP
jgi:hypothetical protein